MSHPADAWMPFYGDDFLESERVSELDPIAQWLYLRMLWRQWKHGSIPNDEAKLQTIFVGFAIDWPKIWPTVRPFFDLCPDGRLRNARCAFEREAAEKRVEASSDRAKRAAETMWERRKKRDRDAQAMLAGSSQHPASNARASKSSCSSNARGIPVPSGQSVPSGPDSLLPPAAGADAPSTPKPPRKTRPPNAYESAWYEVMREHLRSEPAKLPPHGSIALGRIGKSFGAPAIASKLRALLADERQRKFATPKYLEEHWDTIHGTGGLPFDGPSAGFLAEAKSVLARGTPDPKDSTASSQHRAVMAGLAKYGLRPEDILGRVG